jgi:hypothetical protein
VIGAADTKFIQRPCEQGQANRGQELWFHGDEDVPTAQVCRSR